MVMNRLLVLSAASLLIGGGSFAVTGKAVASPSPLVAQNSPPPTGQREGWRGPGQAGFANRLGLTDAQRSQIEQIRSASRQQMDAVLTSEQKEQLRLARQQRQKPNLNLSEQQKARIAAIRQDTKNKMDAVLTAQQKQQLQQLHQQRRQQKPPQS